MSRSIVFLFCIAGGLYCSSARAAVVNFEELTLFTATGPAGSFYNGNAGAGSNSLGWSSGGVFFNNTYTASFDGWFGWSYSNVVDTTTPDFGNQYASIPGGGSNGMGGVTPGGRYAVAFGFAPHEAFFNLPTSMELHSLDITNTTYAALSMANGDPFAKKFGGTSGNDPDFFRVTLTGFDALNATGGILGSIVVDLADYTFADNSLDYILRPWRTVDLSPIAGARSVGLTYSSSDVGPFGINTPTFIALDNLTFTAVPEPGTLGVLGAALGAASLVRRWRRRRCS
jgi:hypothetical protein